MFGPVEHPFLDPLWRRIVMIITCVVWTGIEFTMGNVTWVYIAGGITVYAAWAYLVSYKNPSHPDRLPANKADEDAECCCERVPENET